MKTVILHTNKNNALAKQHRPLTACAPAFFKKNSQKTIHTLKKLNHHNIDRFAKTTFQRPVHRDFSSTQYHFARLQNFLTSQTSQNFFTPKKFTLKSPQKILIPKSSQNFLTPKKFTLKSPQNILSPEPSLSKFFHSTIISKNLHSRVISTHDIKTHSTQTRQSLFQKSQTKSTSVQRDFSSTMKQDFIKMQSENISCKEARTKLPGSKISTQGWVRGIRQHSKNFLFIDLFDGSTTKPLQLVLDTQVLSRDILASGSHNQDEDSKEITNPDSQDDQVSEESAPEVEFGSCISITGTVQQSQGGNQPIDIVVEHLKILGKGGAASNPIQPKRHSTEFLRDHAHLRTRTNLFSHMFRMRNSVTFWLHEFLQSNDFIQIHTPIIASTDCEGAGEAFRVENKDDLKADSYYFGRPAYLTVSGQLHAEALALALGRVYSFGPTFRAEKSKSSRHLAEFWMMEAEMAFFNLDQTMDMIDQMVRFVLDKALHQSAESPVFSHQQSAEPIGPVHDFFGKFVDKSLPHTLEQCLSKPFDRVSYREAIAILQKKRKKFQIEPVFGGDLAREHEEYLTDVAFKHPVFVYDWPTSIKPFYVKKNADGETCGAVDLLVPKVGELVGGSTREDRYDILLENITQAGINSHGDYDWYLDLRKYGSAPHAGFGIGFERLLQFLTGAANIKDTIPIPRTNGSIKF